MTSSARSKLSGWAVFALILIVVIGGMAWATVATLRLTEVNISNERHRNVRHAVAILDGYVRSLLRTEVRRPYTDYLASYRVEPIAFLDESSERIDVPFVEYAMLESSIRTNPAPYDWIELYFVGVDEGRWRTPQPIDREPVRTLLTWMELTHPVYELAARVERATVREQDYHQDAIPANDSTASSREPRSSRNKRSSRARRRGDFRTRLGRKIDAQLRLLPPSECVPASAVLGASLPGEPPTVCSEQAEVQITNDPMVTLWLEGPGFGGDLKLAFVRTAYSGDRRIYLGFLANWAILKEDLLKRIELTHPDADLVPIVEGTPESLATGDTAMAWLPVRLDEGDLPSVTTLAWNRVGTELITTWLAAVLVLALAGSGVGNLVALTERRMQFAYAVTHELRTPLTTLRLYSDMLASDLVPEGARHEYAETMNRESVRLAGLVEGVLEYARLGNHRVKLNPASTDAATLMQSLEETLDARCQECDVTPSPTNHIQNGLTMTTDSDVIVQIAGILISNACRHAKGRENATVVLELSEVRNRFCLDVIDNGPGIHRSDARSIFKPFRRGKDADASARGGIGLGLALAKSWAALLHGRLDLVARHHGVYGGAHFRLEVPLQLSSKS